MGEAKNSALERGLHALRSKTGKELEGHAFLEWMKIVKKIKL